MVDMGHMASRVRAFSIGGHVASRVRAFSIGGHG